MRLVNFYQFNRLTGTKFESRKKYWIDKTNKQKGSPQYINIVQKLKEERLIQRKELKEIAEEKQNNIKKYVKKHKGKLESKDKKIREKATIDYLNYMQDLDKVYSWKSTYRWTYRLVINIETPEGVKSGSSIQEVYYAPPKKDSYGSYRMSDIEIARGEATYVDLGELGTIFAIMPDPSNARGRFRQLVKTTFPTVPSVRNLLKYEEILDHYDKLNNVKDEVLPMFYPTLVRFKDINDPSTMETIYKRKSGSIKDRQEVDIDRFEEVFGSGIKIKNMTIEMIDSPLEWKLDKKLKWIKTMSEKEITNSFRKSREYVTYPVNVINGVGYYILRQGYR